MLWKNCISYWKTIQGRVKAATVSCIYLYCMLCICHFTTNHSFPSFSPQTQRYLSSAGVKAACDTLQKQHCRKKWKGDKRGTSPQPPPPPRLSFHCYFYLTGSNLSSRRGGPSQHGVPPPSLCAILSIGTHSKPQPAAIPVLASYTQGRENVCVCVCVCVYVRERSRAQTYMCILKMRGEGAVS